MAENDTAAAVAIAPGGTPAPAPESAPISASAPAAVASPSPSPEPAVAAAPITAEPAPELVVPAVEPSAVEPAAVDAKDGLKPHTDEPNLLDGLFDDKTKPKPDAVTDGETKPVEAGAEAPVAYDLKLPEGMKVDEAPMKAFTEFLGTNKIAPEVAQSLLDQHTTHLQTAMQAYADHLGQEQHRAFGDMRRDWRKQAMADEEIGGSGWDTTKNTVFSTLRMMVPEKSRAAFNDMLTYTGVADHPEFLRFVNRIGQTLQEPAPPPPNAQPTPQNGKGPGKQSLRQMYADNRAERGT